MRLVTRPIGPDTTCPLASFLHLISQGPWCPGTHRAGMSPVTVSWVGGWGDGQQMHRQVFSGGHCGSMNYPWGTGWDQWLELWKSCGQGSGHTERTGSLLVLALLGDRKHKQAFPLNLTTAPRPYTLSFLLRNPSVPSFSFSCICSSLGPRRGSSESRRP